jgi:branched-chain amino acid transport system ATP-binding protein
MLLNLENINAYYGDVQVLWRVGLHINEGEIVVVVGANASGKSTLINTISGLVKQFTGVVKLEDRSIGTLPPSRIAELGIIQVPEGRRMFPFMTVFENLMLGSHSKRARPKAIENMREIFDLLPILKEREKQLAGSLSGGEQQMCAIGRALMAMPRVLMLDEPTLGVAPLIVQKIFELIGEINKKGTTILLVEQNVHRSLTMANRGYVLENGHITLEGVGIELLRNERLKQAYLGGR